LTLTWWAIWAEKRPSWMMVGASGCSMAFGPCLPVA
jgi:hypothetical protein